MDISHVSAHAVHAFQPSQRGAGHSENDEQRNVPEESEDPLQDPSSPESREVQELQATDRAVRAHEAAHLAAAGSYARGVSFSYTRGPDGRSYATGGEVGIDTSPIPNNPEATLIKAGVIGRAALAPADPSPADRAVAAAASQMALSAQAEIRAKRQEELEETREQLQEQQDSSEDQDTEEGVNPINATSAAEEANPQQDLGQRIADSGALDNEPEDQPHIALDEFI